MRYPTSRLIAPLLLVTMGIVACSLPKDTKSLAGTYVMHLEQRAADTLVLRADGRYVRRYRANEDTTASIDSGSWFLSKNGKLVALRNFPKRWRWIHDCMYTGMVCKALTEPTMLALTLERSHLGFGKFRLGWHSDFGWWYTPVFKP